MTPGGTLYVVGTPIGNLEDMTIRAGRILRSVTLVACEDTRRTRKLLSHLGISVRLTSCHEHKEAACAGEVLSVLTDGGDAAFVSDAGTPGLSDPGRVLVDTVRQAGFPVVPVPGVSAVTAALSVSGFPGDAFHFAGFLPGKREARRRALEGLSGMAVPLVFFEAPHRIHAFLADLLDVFGDRKMVLAREITKVHETILRGTVSGIGAALEGREPRGEITVIVEGSSVSRPGESGQADLEAAGKILAALTTDRALSRKEAASLLARLTGFPRKTLYGLACGRNTE